MHKNVTIQYFNYHVLTFSFKLEKVTFRFQLMHTFYRTTLLMQSKGHGHFKRTAVCILRCFLLPRMSPNQLVASWHNQRTLAKPNQVISPPSIVKQQGASLVRIC